MLKTLRDQFMHLKWILWFVVFLFVFFIFVDWGTGRSGRSRGLAGLAASIGNVSISESQFLKEVRSTEQRIPADVRRPVREDARPDRPRLDHDPERSWTGT